MTPRPALTGFPSLTIILASFLLDACNMGDCVKETGSIESTYLDIKEFDRIRVEGAMEILLMPSATPYARAEATPNILEMIDRQVTDGVWTISTSKCYVTSKPIFVEVGHPRLQEVIMNGSGSLRTGDVFRGDRLDVTLNGSGSAELEVALTNLNVMTNGSGKVDLRGKAENLTIDVSGSGDVNALAFNAYNAEVDVRGSGNVSLTVHRSLGARTLGSGSVRYRGDAKVKVKSEGSGKIEKIDP